MRALGESKIPRKRKPSLAACALRECPGILPESGQRLSTTHQLTQLLWSFERKWQFLNIPVATACGRFSVLDRCPRGGRPWPRRRSKRRPSRRLPASEAVKFTGTVVAFRRVDVQTEENRILEGLPTTGQLAGPILGM